MMWYGVKWYDMICYDMCYMIWCDMIWYDMTWHDMTWHDMTWHDMIYAAWHYHMTWFKYWNIICISICGYVPHERPQCPLQCIWTTQPRFHDWETKRSRSIGNVICLISIRVGTILQPAFSECITQKSRNRFGRCPIRLCWQGPDRATH